LSAAGAEHHPFVFDKQLDARQREPRQREARQREGRQREGRQRGAPITIAVDSGEGVFSR
jgi:hypothetical protein